MCEISNCDAENQLLHIATSSEAQKNLFTRALDAYRSGLKIWSGASTDSIVWKGSRYQSDPATPIKSLSSEIGDGLANKTK